MKYYFLAFIFWIIKIILWISIIGIPIERYLADRIGWFYKPFAEAYDKWIYDL